MSLSQEASSPNILLITTDHLRYDTLGCHADPVIRTGNIDRLAAEGVDFSRCFVQNPVCQPSRASLMTGRYPRNHGVRHNRGVLSRNEVTLVEYFKKAGYTTAVIGKHHITQGDFLEHIDHLCAGHCRRNWKERPDGDYSVPDDQLNEFERYVKSRGYTYRTGFALPGFRENLGAVPSELPADCHLDAYVGMKGVEYLEGRRVNAEPFFLWVGFYGPHHPYVPSGQFAHMYHPDDVPGFHTREDEFSDKPPEYRIYREYRGHKYRGFSSASMKTFRKMKAAYYGMVSQIDWQVGEIIQSLKDSGLFDNTIILFTSDHGEFLGDHGLPAKAPFLLDCMLHVPLVLRGPGCESAAVVDELVEEVDVFPTLCTLTGIETPRWVQGRDLAPLLNPDREGEYRPRTAIYAEMVDKKCIRTERWKFIHYPGRDHGELYDLAEDPHELENLFERMPEKVEEMRKQYYALLDRTEDTAHPVYQYFTGRDPESGEEYTHYLTW